MQVKRFSIWIIVVAVLAVFAVRQVERRVPPFERGIHDDVVEAGTAPGASSGPRIGNCPVFPADNVWNMPIDKLQKDQRSDAYIETIGAEHPLHPDFGSDLNGGIPYSIVPNGTKRVHVTFEYSDESDLGNYPVPADAPIEGGPNGKGDRHVILIEPKRCLLSELFSATPQPDGSWKAGAGIKMDLTDNALRPEGKTSADAAGLPIFPGLVRYDEIQAGEIHHALRFTIPHTQAAYVWPARHKASKDPDIHLPPMGLRVRLRADFDVSGYSRTNQIILTALKRYGMILADNGSPMFISGVADKRWDDSDLHKLTNVKAGDFEAVDESNWQMLADSGRVDPVAARPE